MQNHHPNSPSLIPIRSCSGPENTMMIFMSKKQRLKMNCVFSNEIKVTGKRKNKKLPKQPLRPIDEGERS